MSSKSTIFLTADNEHCYSDCNLPNTKDGKYIGDTIVLEMSKKNIRVIENDEWDLIIEIDPGSELYQKIKQLREP